jgi:pentatricopeptide repeat protein
MKYIHIHIYHACSDCSCAQVTYNSAIAACANLRLWRRGVALLDDMRRRRVQPDQYSYNSAIAACVKAKQTQQMAAVLARMREAGFSPDLVTYSNLIQVRLFDKHCHVIHRHRHTDTHCSM